MIANVQTSMFSDDAWTLPMIYQVLAEQLVNCSRRSARWLAKLCWPVVSVRFEWCKRGVRCDATGTRWTSGRTSRLIASARTNQTCSPDVASVRSTNAWTAGWSGWPPSRSLDYSSFILYFRPRSSFLACNSRLRGAVRRPHPPQRPVLGHIHCFRQCEIVWSQILLHGAQPYVLRGRPRWQDPLGVCVIVQLS